MMKRICVVALLLALSGCVTVRTPRYIPDESPYKKKYFSSFEDVYSAALEALKDLGWKIEEMTTPSVYEQEAGDDTGRKHILIITDVRQTPIFLTSRYMNLNVYLRALDDGTEVEVRYASVMPVLFKTMQSYQNDAVVNKVFDQIAQILGQ